MDEFLNNLENKVGVITGGTSGFGFEIAKGLLAKKSRLAVFSVDELAEERRKEIFPKYEGRALFRIKDITAKGSAAQMASEAVAEYGRLDFIIINAGYAIRFEKPFLSLDEDYLAESLRKQFDVFAVPFACQALEAAKVMAPWYSKVKPGPTGHLPETGSIVVNLSEAVLCPLRDDLLAYAAAKNACLSIMKTLAGILGGYNIRVNAIAPGFANTEGPRKFYSRFPQIQKDIERRNHLKPAFLHPAAVLPAIHYLLTDNYAVGEVIALDGGYNNNMLKYFQNYDEV